MILEYLLPDEDFLLVRLEGAEFDLEHPYLYSDSGLICWEEFREIQQKHAQGILEDHAMGEYVSTRQNLEPSYPQIMRVCRQLYQESCSAVYGRCTVEALICDGKMDILGHNYQPNTQDEALLNMKTHLRPVKHIEVTIKIGLHMTDNEKFNNKILIHRLVTELATLGTIKRLDIILEIRDEMTGIALNRKEEKAALQMLRPFYQVRNVPQVRLNIGETYFHSS
jgi:hypothetical protein